MMGKAPKGGLVSHVNGQFYEGGQFTPDHGKYCGKGKNRVTVVAFAEAVKLAAEKGLVLTYREKFEDFAVAYPSKYAGTISSAKSLKTLAFFWAPGARFHVDPRGGVS